MKKYIIFGLLLIGISISAQELTLEECRRMALENNRQQDVNKENIEAAKDLHKASIASFFPKLTLNGLYHWNEKSMCLMPNAMDFSFGSMNADGTFTLKPIEMTDFSGNSFVINPAKYPELNDAITKLIANGYNDIRDLLKFDIHNVFLGSATITQPIFLGGRLINASKMTKAAVRMEEIKSEKSADELIVSVDEAYWRVLTVESKYELASSYLDLLRKLENDVTELVGSGLATQGDLLKVKVKRQEAEVMQTEADNGLLLSKMALCQLCGLPLDAEINISDDGFTDIVLADSGMVSVEGRNELKILEQARSIAHSGVNMSAAGLMPNIVAEASYYVMNPNLQNGFDNKFAGSFSAGVVVNIPIAHAEDIYALKAAKHKEKALDCQIEDVREKLQLQIKQSEQALMLANRKLLQTNVAIESAEENLRYAEELFSAGMISATEMLQVETAWLEAKSKRIEAAGNLRLAEVKYRVSTNQVIRGT